MPAGLSKASSRPAARQLSRRDSLHEAEYLTQGWIVRAGTAIGARAARKYCALTNYRLLSATDETLEHLHKCWTLHRDCILTDVQRHHFVLADESPIPGVGLYRRATADKTPLATFTIRWPTSHILGSDGLKLAHEDEEEMRRWHSKLQHAISGLSDEPIPPLSPHIEKSDDSPPPQQPVREQSKGQLPEATPASPPPATGQSPPWEQGRQHWASWRHTNGIAVFREREGPNQEGGAYMMSTSLKSTPEHAFEVLIKRRMAIMQHAMTQQTSHDVDASCRILKGHLHATGLASWLCAPRLLVVRQAWRQDSEGTYTILYHSQEEDQPLEEYSYANWWHLWPSTVACRMVAGGFTISPLQPHFRNGSESQECLVTMVYKADYGGWLSPGSFTGRFLRAATEYLTAGFAEPMSQGLLALRDYVEQDRFMVQPTSIGDQHVPEDPAQQQTCSQESSKQPVEAVVHGSCLAEALRLSAHRSTVDRSVWSCPGRAGFNVRGPHYLQDKRKVPAGEPLFVLASTDLVQTPKPCRHISRHLASIRDSHAPFTFVVSILIPGPPHRNLVMAWATSRAPGLHDAGDGSGSNRSSSHSEAGSSFGQPHLPMQHASNGDMTDTAPEFERCLDRFLHGDDRERSARFKLIPSIAKGSWIIKQSVGNTPVLLGRKLRTSYFRGERYFEVNIDVSSSSVARNIVGRVSGTTTSLVVDMAFLLQGNDRGELPEHLLGTVRFSHLDLRTATKLDVSD